MNTSTEDINPLFNQSLEKGLAVLCAFSAQNQSMTMGDIANAIGISKSSAQRMVYTLEQLGFLRKHPRTRRYQLTPRVMRIGFNYLAATPVIDLANPYLSELTNTTKETTCLTEADGTEMVYLARFVSSLSVPIHMPIGIRIPMHCTASGKAWLSALPEEEARALIRSMPLVTHTRNTITDEDALVQELRETRARGYAINCEEMFLGDMNIGAPVIGSHGRPVATVHVVAPTNRWTLEEAEKKLGPALLACARSLNNAVRNLS